MRIMMRSKMMSKSMGWSAAHLAWMTMAFSPVALGKEAENISQKNIENIVKELGLDKKITMAEFWKKARGQYPVAIQKDVDTYVNEHKNVLMPQVTVKSLKATDGTMVPAIETSQNGEVHTVQYFGEKNKFMKTNKVNFTQQDVERFYDVFLRYEASDAKARKAGDEYKQNQKDKALKAMGIKPGSKTPGMAADLARFDGFPRVTPVLWKSLSKQERANYIVKMRLMWETAQKVNSPFPKKTAQNSLQNIQQLLIGEEAVAATKAKAADSSDKRCIVAGYVGEYAAGLVNARSKNTIGCSVDRAIEATGSKSVSEANITCKANGADSVACNPVIYGYPNGSPACISRTSPEFLDATHFNAANMKDTCDTKSRLGTSPDVVKFQGKDYSKIMPREKQLEAIEQDQKTEDFSLTKSFLDGVLKSKDKDLAQAFADGKWTPALDSSLIEIQSQFETDIKKAIEVCEMTVGKPQADSRQKGACDQLHRRWLFAEQMIAQLRSKACDPASTYIGKYDSKDSSDAKKEKTALNKKAVENMGANLCQCNNVPGKKVGFGGRCEEASLPPITVTAEKEKITAQECAAIYPGASDMKEDCTCKLTNQAPVLVEQKTSYKSQGAGEAYPNTIETTKAQEEKFTCDKSDTNLVPWLLGAAGIGAAFLIFGKKKKSTPTTPIVIPPTVVPPVVAACVPPKTGTPPNCACPIDASNSCTNGQGVYNQATCVCVPKPPVEVPPVTCADGSSAPSNNASLCPKCSDGSFKTTPSTSRPDGCPAPTPAPSEGGTGNSCPAGGCSGGVPTTNQ